MQPPASSAVHAPPPEVTLAQMLWGALMQRSLCVATKLGVPDLLAAQPQTAADLATQTGANEPSLYRLLRTLASAGIFSETHDHRFELTPISQLLRRDVPGSMRDLAVMFAEDWQWRNWGELMHCVMTGNAAQHKLYGMDSFAYFTAQPALGAVFNRAMTGLSAAVAPAIAEAYDFSRTSTVVEVAGGHGLLLAAILKRNPKMRGILFDLPDVLVGCGELLDREGVRDRVELAAGDFFQSVTPGADLYTMKHIIHDWDDAKSLQILRNIRAAMKPDGRVLTIEMVVPEGNEPSPSKILDLQMMIMEGGKERTAGEYEALYELAGLGLTRILPTMSPFSLIEGKIR
ncbi:MAG: helix-turn-helix domain-containing protein [Chthoniobacterales bacterium]|nr:helix-turn-helix domain-containing protein [Chthoniobacterales bacterium]